MYLSTRSAPTCDINVAFTNLPEWRVQSNVPGSELNILQSLSARHNLRHSSIPPITLGMDLELVHSKTVLLVYPHVIGYSGSFTDEFRAQKEYLVATDKAWAVVWQVFLTGSRKQPFQELHSERCLPKPRNSKDLMSHRLLMGTTSMFPFPRSLQCSCFPIKFFRSVFGNIGSSTGTLRSYIVPYFVPCSSCISFQNEQLENLRQEKLKKSSSEESIALGTGAHSVARPPKRQLWDFVPSSNISRGIDPAYFKSLFTLCMASIRTLCLSLILSFAQNCKSFSG
mmetsp:Transcript_7136/g.12743  ORF Transcript_7136/g.12743 Transcript_7136/m.12743 type:complete len:283 (-) Transcript_7136:1743-2591(-)